LRSLQRVNKKTSVKTQKERTESGALFVSLKPAGYPLRSSLHEYPEVFENNVFEFYAREQWNGLVVQSGEYLFDRRMFPDFAFKVVNVMPEGSVIGQSTVFLIEDVNNDEVVPEPSNDITFDDVIGQDGAKLKCKLIMKFLDDPEQFGKWAPRNVLFYGPSGTGKTMLAKALASATDVPILPIKATQLIGEFVGDGARQLHQLYDRAEDLQPCIIFIDELDAIALDRHFQELRGDVVEIVNSLLTEMDGIEVREGICTIAATNRIESLDPAVRSRFEEEINFVLPDLKERQAILLSNIATFPVELEDDVDLKVLAEKTEGFSGRDLVEKILKSALHAAILEDALVGNKHLEDALKRTVESSLFKNSDEGMFR
jgi:AAA family ATPase